MRARPENVREPRERAGARVRRICASGSRSWLARREPAAEERRRPQDGGLVAVAESAEHGKRRLRVLVVAQRESHSASGTITSPDSGTSGSPPAGPRLSSSQLSATMRRSFISVAIHEFLEGFDADAVHHVDEALGVAVAAREVAIDQPLDH